MSFYLSVVVIIARVKWSYIYYMRCMLVKNNKMGLYAFLSKTDDNDLNCAVDFLKCRSIFFFYEFVVI
jgi:hypothetical protein